MESSADSRLRHAPAAALCVLFVLCQTARAQVDRERENSGDYTFLLRPETRADIDASIDALGESLNRLGDVWPAERARREGLRAYYRSLREIGAAETLAAVRLLIQRHNRQMVDVYRENLLQLQTNLRSAQQRLDTARNANDAAGIAEFGPLVALTAECVENSRAALMAASAIAGREATHRIVAWDPFGLVNPRFHAGVR